MVAFLPEPSGGSFALAPAGTHRAVCYRLIDLGTRQKTFQGVTKTLREVMLSWELSDEFMDDSRPFTINKFYTWSMHEKANLRKDLEAWRGKPFEESDFGPEGRFKPRNLLGAPCMLNVIHGKSKSGDTRESIAGIMSLPKGTEKPTLHNAKVYFSLDEFDVAAFEGLSDKIKAMIAESPEYKALRSGGQKAPAQRLPDDDIPF